MKELKAWIEKNRKYIEEGNAAEVYDKYNQIAKRAALRKAVYPGKQEHDDIPDGHVDRSLQIINTYLKDKGEHEDKLREIDRTYKGEVLQEKYSAEKANKPLIPTYIEALDTFRQLELLELDAVEAQTWDKISPDYGYLQLPVALEAADIAKLHKRNQNDPMFCKALRKYYADHDIQEELDLRDTLTVKRDAINQLFETCRDMTIDRADNSFIFATYEAMNYFENIKGKLELGVAAEDGPTDGTIVASLD